MHSGVKDEERDALACMVGVVCVCGIIPMVGCDDEEIAVGHSVRDIPKGFIKGIDVVDIPCGIAPVTEEFICSIEIGK